MNIILIQSVPDFPEVCEVCIRVWRCIESITDERQIVEGVRATVRAHEDAAGETDDEHRCERDAEPKRAEKASAGRAGGITSRFRSLLFSKIVVVPFFKRHRYNMRAFGQYSIHQHEEILRVLWRADVLARANDYNEVSMVTRHARGKVMWVDLESPTRQELAETMREFAVDAHIEEEIAQETPYPLIVSSAKYHYLILHFPAREPTGGARAQEIDFIVGKNFLITVRYEPINSIHNLHRIFEAEELLGLAGTGSTDALFERIIRRLYGAIREEIEVIGRHLDRIEHDIFGGKERRTMREISEANRILLRFDMMIKRHEENLAALLTELQAPAFFGKAFADSAIHIEAEREHVASLISTYREMAEELRDTNDSLLSASQNEVMKTLTVITFIILPLTLITSVFQMNLLNLPLRSDPNGFWYIIAAGVVVTAFLIWYVKRNKWL